MIRVARHLWRSSNLTILLEQVHPEHIAQDHVHVGLKISRGGDSTISLDSLTEHSVTLTVKNGEGMVRMKLEPEAGTRLVQPGEGTVLRGSL